MGMLRQGARYIECDRIPNVYVARGRVEALPFRPAFLDGAVCGGSLHLFADTVAALREIAQRAAALYAEGWSAQTRPQDETARQAGVLCPFWPCTYGSGAQAWRAQALFFVPLLLTRYDDGDRSGRRIEGNGLALVWAPEGPGRNWHPLKGVGR